MNTPQFRQDWIYEQLETDGGLTYGDCFTRYALNFTKTKRTFNTDWNIAQQRHKELQQAKERAITEAMVGEAVKAAQNGLKSKYERMASLEAHIKEMEAELADGEVVETKFDGKAGKPLQYTRKMTVNEATQIRRTIAVYHVELSKMQGDYAAEKIDIDGDFGTVVVLPANGRNE